MRRPALVLALLLAACDGEGAGELDASPDVAGDPSPEAPGESSRPDASPDAGADASAPGDVAESSSDSIETGKTPEMCDLVTSKPCPAGEKCTPREMCLMPPVCWPSAGAGAAGARCADYHDCAPGLTCIVDTCRRFCRETADCMGWGACTGALGCSPDPKLRYCL